MRVKVGYAKKNRKEPALVDKIFASRSSVSEIEFLRNSKHVCIKAEWPVNSASVPLDVLPPSTSPLPIYLEAST